MPDPRAEPCRVCHSAEHLQAKWMSETGEKWVHCDSCGNISTPTIEGDPLLIWNAEQTAPKVSDNENETVPTPD